MCAVGFPPGLPLANALGHVVLGTLVSRPQMGRRGRRRSMRAGHKRSQDDVPAQAAPWGEIRQRSPRTDPKPRKNAVSVGEKISRPPISTFYINGLRTAPRGSGGTCREVAGVGVEATRGRRLRSASGQRGPPAPGSETTDPAQGEEAGRPGGLRGSSFAG